MAQDPYGRTPERPPSQERPTPWYRRGWVLPACLTVLSLVFIFENRARTDIRLIIPVVSMPLWVALLIVWVAGLVAGLGIARRRRRRRERRAQRRG